MKPTQHLPPVKRFIAVRVVPAFIVLASTLFTYLGVENARLAAETRTWPAVDGEIVRSDVVEERSQSQTRAGDDRRVYRSAIRYRYRVDGADYEGERVSLGEYATEDRADADAVVQRYPVGRRLPVHCRPGAPEASVLEPGNHGLPWLYAAIGSVFLLAGLVLAWLAPKLIAPAR